jgi:hypothetical protein
MPELGYNFSAYGSEVCGMLLVGESLILLQIFLSIVKLSFHSLFGVVLFFYSTPPIAQSSS